MGSMKTKNIKVETKELINFFIRELSENDWVEGIVLLGGLGKRQFIDEFSDLDIAIFWIKGVPKQNLLPFEFHYSYHQRRFEFNIHQLYFDQEDSNQWDTYKKNAYANGKIVYDRTGKIEKLIIKKIKIKEDELFRRLLWIIQQYNWRGHIHSINAFKRGFPEVSHHLLNECLDILIESIYILNKKEKPHTKWQISFLPTLNWVPKNGHQNIKKSLIINDYSIKDIRRRIRNLDDLFEEINKKAKKIYKNFPKEPYKAYYQNFIQLTPDSWISNFVDSLGLSLSQRELEQVEGFLCLNLISSYSELVKKLKNNREQLPLEFSFYLANKLIAR